MMVIGLNDAKKKKNKILKKIIASNIIMHQMIYLHGKQELLKIKEEFV